ncbi:MAG: glycosyltransferase family 1 protein, partial [Ginsengibacter sp.]
MKILFITHKFYPHIGGIEVNSEILANSFHEAGHEIKLVTWSEDPGKKPYPFEVVRNPGVFMLISLHRWAETIFENNISLRLSWPSFFFKKPRIIAIRTWIARMDGTLGWQDKLKIKILNNASAVIAISESVRRKTWPAATVIGNPYRR